MTWRDGSAPTNYKLVMVAQNHSQLTGGIGELKFSPSLLWQSSFSFHPPQRDWRTYSNCLSRSFHKTKTYSNLPVSLDPWLYSGWCLTSADKLLLTVLRTSLALSVYVKDGTVWYCLCLQCTLDIVHAVSRLWLACDTIMALYKCVLNFWLTDWLSCLCSLDIHESKRHSQTSLL